MTLDEAIKRLQESVAEIGADELDTLSEAERLGIEALKRVKLEHERDGVKVKWCLPGETGE